MANAIPKRRWFRSRKLLYAGLLMVLCLGAYSLHGWLFMPEDLRLMQGKWNLVCEESAAEGRITHVPGQPWVLSGSRLKITSWGGGEFYFRVEPSERRFFFYDPSDCERSFLGTKVNLPVWLVRPKDFVYGKYDLIGDEMMLWVQGEIAGRSATDGDDIKLYFKRP